MSLEESSISLVLTGMSPEQWKQILADNDWNEVDLRDSRYNQVVHMVSTADASTGRRRHFSSHEGMDIATARQLDLAVSQVHTEPLCASTFVNLPYLSPLMYCSRTDLALRVALTVFWKDNKLVIIIIIIISTTMFMVLSSCHHGRAIARVHPVHLMNVEWRQAAADPRPSQTT